jgi:3-hydroxyacyl-[acyl-carrier-protein] dehydratase
MNGLLADGQCFTPAQIHKCLLEQNPDFDVNVAFPISLRTISADLKAKKPGDTIFKTALASLAARKLAPGQVLVIGSSIDRDLSPAKKLGLRTALFAGDKNSLAATAEQLKDPATRPDVLLTDLAQLPEVLYIMVDFDLSKVVADSTAIRNVLPHRFEMEMLTAIVHIDKSTHTIVGYKDTTPQDFWVRGHFPQVAVMPGVLMCEAAAQLCCYYTLSQGIVDPLALQGLGGLEEVRFQGTIKPGERLVMVGRGEKVNRRMNKFRVTGMALDRQVFEALVIGVPLGKWEDLAGA